ncbi:MAG: dTDP-4-dehydrorhamnose 3,5-epimerase, partial [Caldilineaceae bacterium]|nr:dTDP-4-dehydrorhamnose 3,5-epimerase [Caldilineaceae bacterium]
YWFCVNGTVQVALADLRPDSPTFRQTETLEIGEHNYMGVFIPVGVAHGFLALTDAVLTYNVDNYYDNSDEHGVAWNDPDLAVEWKQKAPQLSDRDRGNPFLADLSVDHLPRYVSG